MELIKELEKLIDRTDMRYVESYYDGSFGGVRFEKVGETGEEGVYSGLEYKGYLVSSGFDVKEFQTFVTVKEANPEIVVITMTTGITEEEASLIGGEDGEVELPLLGTFIFDEGKFQMTYSWPMGEDAGFLRVLKTMGEEFGSEAVWLESEWG